MGPGILAIPSRGSLESAAIRRSRDVQILIYACRLELDLQRFARCVVSNGKNGRRTYRFTIHCSLRRHLAASVEGSVIATPLPVPHSCASRALRPMLLPLADRRFEGAAARPDQIASGTQRDRNV